MSRIAAGPCFTGMRTAPLLLLIDPTGEEPKELRRVAGGSARQMRAVLEGALKRLPKQVPS